MRTILLTGANGFIGKHLLAYIKSNPDYASDRIVLLTSAAVAGYECLVCPDYQVRRTDFDDAGITQVDIFVHLGSFTPKKQEQANDPMLCSRNITFTLACLAALPSSLQCLIYTSTLDVYDASSECLSEESPVNPMSLYGWSKLYSEQLVQHWTQQHGTVCQILRLGHIYGPGEEAYRKLIPQTIRLLQAGQSPVIYTDGAEVRSFLHVADCCRLIMNAIELPHFIGPVNVASSHSVSVLELVQLLKELTGSKQAIEVQNTVKIKRNLTFNNAKMNQWLGHEAIVFKMGLAQEVAVFNN